VFLVDTNVLVYVADRDSPFHVPCREALDAWRGQASAWYVTWPILYEFLRVATHPRIMREPWSAGDARGFVDSTLAAPGLGVLSATDRHQAVLAKVIEEIPHLSGNLMHDLHTAVLMREHGISKIYTRDTDFHRFPFLEVVDPLTQP
jgi:toxin-antitoxin system PIN domain toxin